MSTVTTAQLQQMVQKAVAEAIQPLAGKLARIQRADEGLQIAPFGGATDNVRGRKWIAQNNQQRPYVEALSRYFDGMPGNYERLTPRQIARKSMGLEV